MIKEELFELYFPYPNLDKRLVRVYVPEHENGETLPVIYMTDGQNLFDENERQFGCWHTRESIKAEKAQSGNSAIIVGIHNDCGPMQRTNELTPESIGDFYFPKEMPEELKKGFIPQGEIFDDFLINSVIPEIESRFPVKKGRNNTAVCGSSSGGLQAFFTALSHPEKICAAGVFSPNFMIYYKEDLARWIQSKVTDPAPFLYIYSGGGDELEKHIMGSVDETYDVLMDCYPMDKMTEVILPEQRHHESAWESIFKDFLHTFLIRGNEF